jgi:hypothetical protein
MLYYWNAPAVKDKARKVAQPVKKAVEDTKESAETSGAKTKSQRTRRRG